MAFVLTSILVPSILAASAASGPATSAVQGGIASKKKDKAAAEESARLAAEARKAKNAEIIAGRVANRDSRRSSQAALAATSQGRSGTILTSPLGKNLSPTEATPSEPTKVLGK